MQRIYFKAGVCSVFDSGGLAGCETAENPGMGLWGRRHVRGRASGGAAVSVRGRSFPLAQLGNRCVFGEFGGGISFASHSSHPRSNRQRRRMVFYNFRFIPGVLEKYCPAVLRIGTLLSGCRRRCCMGEMDGHLCQEKTASVSSVSFARRACDDEAVEEQLHLAGSLTVEAAFVVTMVFLSLAFMLCSAFEIHDQTVGAMSLHEAVALGSHETDLDRGKVKDLGNSQMERMILNRVNLELEDKGTEIKGSVNAENWGIEITQKDFYPEDFLRKVTLLKQLKE